MILLRDRFQPVNSSQEGPPDRGLRTRNNVNVRETAVTTIPCFLCGAELTVRTDKNGKPYLLCNPCASQHFIRRKQGRDRLAELGHYFYEHKAELDAHLKTLLRVQARLRG